MMPTEGLSSCHELRRDTEESDDCRECRTDDTTIAQQLTRFSTKASCATSPLQSVISPYAFRRSTYVPAMKSSSICHLHMRVLM